MATLFIANKNYSSWSLRPWILLRERAIPFTEELVPFEADTNWSLFRRFSPSGRVPCLVEGDTTVWDSLAIVEYLADRDLEVWPRDPRVRAWARCAAAEMHSGFAVLRERCSMNCGVRVRLREMPEDLRRDVERISELWSQGLGRFGGPFLAGPRFTAVDAFFAPVAFRVQTYGLEVGAATKEYARRLLALDGMRDWYDAALKERWRDQAHEDDIPRSGTLLEDLRVAP